MENEAPTYVEGAGRLWSKYWMGIILSPLVLLTVWAVYLGHDPNTVTFWTRMENPQYRDGVIMGACIAWVAFWFLQKKESHD